METDVTAKIKDFFAAYPVKKFSKSTVIVQAEDKPDGVFCLEKGRVSQYDISPSGSTIVVNVYKPPAFFPMSWAINGTPNHYFFEATTDIVLYRAPAHDAVTFLQDNPDVLFDLLARVYRGTDGLLRRMAHLMGGDAKSRLQFELLNAAYRFGEVQSDGSTFVPLKESDLARHSGLARETVNRHIQSLKTAGLVEVTHHGFMVRDFAKLEVELGNAL